MRVFLLFVAAACLAKDAPKAVSPLDALIAATAAAAPASAAGSLWTSGAAFGELGSDLRPRRVNDLVTVLVLDRASAVAKGSTKSARTSSAQGGINAIAGPRQGKVLPDFLRMGSQTSLDGEGETARETLLRTTLTARVTHVLPNGALVVEGLKTVRVNSETQTVAVRGLLRPYDVSPANTVVSDQLAMLEVSINGKGVVGDAIRRPNFLYRLLLGLLPF